MSSDTAIPRGMMRCASCGVDRPSSWPIGAGNITNPPQGPKCECGSSSFHMTFYSDGHPEARADSAVPSSHVSGEYERGYEHGHADATRQAITGSTYTYAVGDAGQRYMARFEHAHPLPALFRWQELWDAMSSAAAVHHEAPEPNDPNQSIEGVAKP